MTKSQKSAKEEALREKRLPARSKEESPLRSKVTGTRNRTILTLSLRNRMMGTARAKRTCLLDPCLCAVPVKNKGIDKKL